MKKPITGIALIATLIAAGSFGGMKPLDPESNWAVIIAAPPSTAQIAELEPAVRRMAAMLRADYGLRPDRIVQVMEDVGPSRLSSVFGRISQERGIRTTVLVYIAAQISSSTYESGREIYLIPSGASPKETWRLTPLSRVLSLLPRDAAVIVILADCLDEESRYSKYLFDVSPTEMPRLNFLTMCPRTLDLVSSTNRVFAALREFNGSKLTLKDLYGRLNSPKNRVYLVQDPIGNGPPFELPHRTVDRWQAYLTALTNAATDDEKTTALEDLVKAMSAESNVPVTFRNRAASTILNFAAAVSEQERVRSAAINAIARLRLNEAATPLVQIATSAREDPALRVAAIDALDKLTVTDRATYIENALNDPDARLRVAAIRSARNARDERFVAKIASRIQTDDSDDVTIAALQAVSDFNTARDVVGSAVRWALENGRSEAVRSEAVLTWGRLGESLTDPQIASMLRSDPDKGVRETIALSLGRSRFDPQQLPAVESMLAIAADSTMPPEVRRAAMTSWRRIGGDHSIAALIKGLSDRDDSVKLAAIAGLNTATSRAAVPALMELTRSDNTELRRSTIRALGDIGDPLAITTLRIAMKDGDASVRDEAVKAIQKIKAEPSEGELLEALNDPAPAVRALSLGRVSGQAATPAVLDRVVALLGDSDAMVRQSAIAALTTLDPGVSLPRLERALASDQFLQRAAAAEALGRIGDPQTAPMLRKLRFDQNPLVRSEVVKALGRLPDRETHLDVFLTSGRDPDIAVRLASVEALQKVPSERAKAMLKVLANDDASAVRVAAAQALSPR